MDFPMYAGALLLWVVAMACGIKYLFAEEK